MITSLAPDRPTAEPSPCSKYVQERHLENKDPFVGNAEQWQEHDIQVQLLMDIDPSDIVGY